MEKDKFFVREAVTRSGLNSEFAPEHIRKVKKILTEAANQRTGGVQKLR